MPFLIGAAVGYVLGTKAGRERYEQIKQASKQFSENPTVHDATETIRTRATELAGTAKEKVNTKMGSSSDSQVPGMRHDNKIGQDTPASVSQF